MLGTEKQVKYAKDILQLARKYFESMLASNSENKVTDLRAKEQAKRHLAAIDFIEAVEDKRFTEAAEIHDTQDVPPWILGYHVVASIDSNSKAGWKEKIEKLEDMVVLSWNVIEHFKKYAFLAKQAN